MKRVYGPCLIALALVLSTLSLAACDSTGGGDTTSTDDSGDGTGEAGVGMTLTEPNGGETWQTGTSYTIEWSTTLTSPLVRIELEKNGEYCLTIVESTPNDGSHPWSIPASVADSESYRVNIKTLDNAGKDKSDKYFTIKTKPFLRVTAPNGGESWGTPYSKHITWVSAGAGDNVKIELYYGSVKEGTIISSTPNDGDYSWKVDCYHPQSPDPDKLIADYRVKITSTSDGSLSDMSDGYFEIWDPL